MAHWEMIAAMIYQLTRGASVQALKAAGLDTNFAQHGMGIFPSDVNGAAFTTSYMQVTGDPIADLTEDMAAEQKARVAYEHLMTLTDDVDVINPLRFLREREIVHFQRFGECLNIVQSFKLERSCDNSIGAARNC